MRTRSCNCENVATLKIADGYSIEEVDAMTGPVIGRPKSASFRTTDIVGLDTALYVAENLYPMVPHDEKRDVLVPPDFLREMVKRGWLGNGQQGDKFLVVRLGDRGSDTTVFIQ